MGIGGFWSAVLVGAGANTGTGGVEVGISPEGTNGGIKGIPGGEYSCAMTTSGEMMSAKVAKATAFFIQEL
jgi:hypothetical protein